MAVTTTFLPAPRAHRARLLLGLPLCLLTGAAALVAGWTLFAPHRAQVSVEARVLTVTAGAAPFTTVRQVPVADLVSMRPVQAVGGRRAGGTALPGYCVGRFSYPELGEVWQATSCQPDALLLTFRSLERPLLVAPEPRGVFLLVVNVGGRFTAEPIRPLPGAWRWGLAALALPMPLLTVFLALLFFSAPARLAYTVRPGSVEIATIFGTRTLPTSGLSARRHRPRVGIRLWGTALPGYLHGWFRVDRLRTRVYATDVTGDCVLLSNGGRTLLSPADPDELLAALGEVGVTVTDESPSG